MAVGFRPTEDTQFCHWPSKNRVQKPFLCVVRPPLTRGRSDNNLLWTVFAWEPVTSIKAEVELGHILLLQGNLPHKEELAHYSKAAMIERT